MLLKLFLNYNINISKGNLKFHEIKRLNMKFKDIKKCINAINFINSVWKNVN